MNDQEAKVAPFKVRGDKPFYTTLIFLSLIFIVLLFLMLLALLGSTTLHDVKMAFQNEAIIASIKLSLITCTITAILSVWVAVPIGYLMSRFEFSGKNFLDAFLDIPIVLPPLVVGLGLLVMFSYPLGWNQPPFTPGLVAEPWTLEAMLREKMNFPVTFSVPAVILAQFMVACAFAVRTMRNTFDQISPRMEEVALTLGCNRGQAFWNVLLPQSAKGVLAAGTLAWSRSLGEFGPILIFASATRFRTEVLPTSVYLEFSKGDSEAAVAVSLILVGAAIAVLVLTRILGKGKRVVE